MALSFFWIGVGLAALGYFIGDGLKNFKNPKGSGYPTLINEKDLPIYFGLSKEEILELLRKYPNAPKIELNGTTYFPYHQFLEWLSSNDIYKN
ncbi:DNA-binding protein [Psychrobacillus sp. PGGUH221]|uniref:DNA-binding protein n=1 Tax=Psychrobacillus sp. PGGUH221 TaxID=3020058 RepID=UPI0035C67D41